jgi:hypothetical protein
MGSKNLKWDIAPLFTQMPEVPDAEFDIFRLPRPRETKESDEREVIEYLSHVLNEGYISP